jgi:hypothetical protein
LALLRNLPGAPREFFPPTPGSVPIEENPPGPHIVGVSRKENVMRDEKKETRGGNKVDGGFYLNRKTWDLVTVNGKKGVLPGNADDLYLKVPTLAMLVAAPVLGATLVVFLPFIGFVLFAVAGLRKVAGLDKAEKAAEPARETR